MKTPEGSAVAIVNDCSVSVDGHCFKSLGLHRYEGQNVLVVWDESDAGRQVWVGNLQGELLAVAALVAQDDVLGR